MTAEAPTRHRNILPLVEGGNSPRVVWEPKPRPAPEPRSDIRARIMNGASVRQSLGLPEISRPALLTKARSSDVQAGFPRKMTRATSIMGTVILLFGLTVLLGASIPMFFGYHWLTVYGGSMGDSIPAGSIALMENVPADDLAVGDVILREANGGPPFVHRIISIEESNGQQLVITQGDANDSPDVDLLRLEGRGERVVLDVPYLGRIFHSLRSTTGLIALLGGASAVWVLGHAGGFVRRRLDHGMAAQ